MKDIFKSNGTEISRLELLDLPFAIDSTMLTDEDMQWFVNQMAATFPIFNETDSEQWWKDLEDMAIHNYDMKYYEDYTDKELDEVNARIETIEEGSEYKEV